MLSAAPSCAGACARVQCSAGCAPSVPDWSAIAAGCALPAASAMPALAFILPTPARSAARRGVSIRWSLFQCAAMGRGAQLLGGARAGESSRGVRSLRRALVSGYRDCQGRIYALCDHDYGRQGQGRGAGYCGITARGSRMRAAAARRPDAPRRAPRWRARAAPAPRRPPCTPPCRHVAAERCQGAGAAGGSGRSNGGQPQKPVCARGGGPS